MSLAGRTLRILVGISVLAQTIWFEPDSAGYYPTACSYLGNGFSAYAVLLYLLPAVGIAIIIGIWKLQSWAWAMAITLSLFVLFQSGIYLKYDNLFPILLLQIAAALICCIGFCIAVTINEIGRREIIAAIIALILAVVIIYVRGSYFRTLSIDYERPIPGWLEIWDHSNFVGTKAIFLWWGLFWATIFAHRKVCAAFRNSDDLRDGVGPT